MPRDNTEFTTEQTIHRCTRNNATHPEPGLSPPPHLLANHSREDITHGDALLREIALLSVGSVRKGAAPYNL